MAQQQKQHKHYMVKVQMHNLQVSIELSSQGPGFIEDFFANLPVLSFLSN